MGAKKEKRAGSVSAFTSKLSIFCGDMVCHTEDKGRTIKGLNRIDEYQMDNLTPISAGHQNRLFFSKASQNEPKDGDPDVINLNPTNSKSGYKFKKTDYDITDEDRESRS